MKLGKLFVDTKTGGYIISRSHRLCVKLEQFSFPEKNDIWTIPHDYDTESVNIQVFADNELIIPEYIIIDDLNTIRIEFHEPQSGFCNVLFYTNKHCECDDVINPSPTPTPTLTSTPTVTPTSTVTPTATATPTVTVTPTSTVTPTVTSTVTPTVTATVTPTQSVTATVTPTVTSTVTPTVTPTNTVTPTATTGATPTVGEST